MKYPKLDKWCADATKKIRYGPDREKVSLELRQHMEDKCDSLRAQCIPEEELEEKVLQSMGDCEEIAPQLAAVHKPLLGYIYSAVKGMSIIACLIVAFEIAVFSIDLATNLISIANYKSLADKGQNSIYLEPNVSAYEEGYLFHVEEAAVSGDTLYFHLRITYWPWMQSTGAHRHFWAVDSEGNIYPSIKDEYYEDIPRISASGSFSSAGISTISMRILKFDTKAQWVELHYDRDGRDMVLRIDLTGGGSE